MRGTLYILVVLILTAGAALASAPATAPPTSPQAAAVVVLHGPINAVRQSSFISNFNLARNTGAQTIIIDLDTYGGVVRNALEISQFIKSQSGVHTIAYIQNKAYSAGAMIALACDEIVMADHAQLGDCAPIMIRQDQGIEPMPETERSKQESPILADFRDSAQRNGYNVPLVLSMVTLKPVYWIQQTDGGDRRYVFEHDYNALTASPQWRPVPGSPNPVSHPDTLLTVSGKESLHLKLASALAPSRTELLADRHLSQVGVFQPGSGEVIVDFLNNDIVRGILLTVFLATLYIALHAPGHGAAEVVALFSLALLVGVPLLTGYAQWWEIVAIFMGIALLAVELFLIPGFGIAGIAGIALILGGLVLTFIAPEPGRSPLNVPSLPVTWEHLQRGLLTVVSALAASLLICLWLRRHLPNLPYFRRLILTTTVGGSDDAMAGSLTNIDPLDQSPAIGALGKAITDLRPGGSAEFRDPAGGSHIVSVVSESGYVSAGSSVSVREVGCGRVVVRKAEA